MTSSPANCPAEVRLVNEIKMAAQAGIPVYGYTPIQVKQAITGTGRANKEQVTYMVQKLLHIEEKPKPDDVADALAIGITGLNFIREQELQERMR